MVKVKMTSVTSSSSSSCLQIEDLKEILLGYQKRQQKAIQQSTSSEQPIGSQDVIGEKVRGDLNDDEQLGDTLNSLTSTCTSFDEEGWDEIMIDHPNNDLNASSAWHQSSQYELLTPHAVGHQSFVCGIEENVVSKESNNSTGTGMSIRWRTSLAPNRILQVASNTTGSVVAATTDQGTVSILRGRDGKVLATRRFNVTNNTDTEKAPASMNDEVDGSSTTNVLQEVQALSDYVSCSRLSFVVSPPTANSSPTSEDVNDALLVFSPDNGGQVLLISNIQGDKLNDNRDTVVAQATQAMNLHNIKIPLLSHQSIYSMTAFFVRRDKERSPNSLDQGADNIEPNINEIQIILVHGGSFDEGKLAAAKYDLESRTCTLLNRDIFLESTEVSKLAMSGIDKMQMKPVPCMSSSRVVSQDRYLLSFVSYRELKKHVPLLCWLDPTDISLGRAKILGMVPLRMSTNHGHSYNELSEHSKIRVSAIKFVDSPNHVDTIAVSAVLQCDGRTEVQILQSRIIQNKPHNTRDSPVFSIGPIYKVYTIPIPIPSDEIIRSVSLTSIESSFYGPYSFRAKIGMGFNRPQKIFLFKTINEAHDGSAIGNIRALSDMGEFNEARGLVHRVGMEILLNDLYANFHPSEIALQRLVGLLKGIKPQIERSISTPMLRECLDIIERGAGHPEGQRVVLETAHLVLDWPRKKSRDGAPSVGQIVVVVSMTLGMIQRISNAFSDEDVNPFVTEQYADVVLSLSGKVTTMQYLQSILENDRFGNSHEEISNGSAGCSIPISLDFAMVQSPNDLFLCFTRNRLFHAAEELWRSHLKSKLTSQEMVAAILEIPSSCHPNDYGSMLKDIIICNLSVSHELLPPCLAWSCRMADEFDDLIGLDDGLDRGIILLQMVDRATKQLNLRVHSSFAHYSPFFDRIQTDLRDGAEASFRSADLTESLPLGGNMQKQMSTTSLDGSIVVSAAKSRRFIPTNSNDTENFERPNHTILELGTMKRGAQKARLGQIPSLREDAFETNEGSVEIKLHAARCLKLARSMGLDKNVSRLRDFSYNGGAQYVAKELIRHVLTTSVNPNEVKIESLLCNVHNFCKATKAEYDLALVSYAKELCGEKRTNPHYVELAASIARCCETSTSKCEITLTVLRTALFCHFSPRWLTQLSKDAIGWAAGDSSLRTELEEASRLILIDEIIGRYCGGGAKEMFHVDNPLHAIRLLEFLTLNLNHELVLSDVFHLCEAFHHLSEEEGCGRLIQNAILQNDCEKVQFFLSSVYERNQSLAHTVYGNAIALCIDIIEDGSAIIGTFGDQVIGESNEFLSQKRDVMAATSCARTITKIALNNSTIFREIANGIMSTAIYFEEQRLRQLSHNLARVHVLQNDHNIFVSPGQLDDPTVVAAVAETLLTRIAHLYENGQPGTVNNVATQTKRAITILSDASGVNEKDLVFAASLLPACELARTTDGFEVLDFLSGLGVTIASENKLANRCIVAVSVALAMESSSKLVNAATAEEVKMRSLVKATSLLQDYAATRCASSVIGVLVTLLDVFDIIFRTLTRADEGVGETITGYRQILLEQSAAEKRLSFNFSFPDALTLPASPTSSHPALHPTWYVGDGLLLPPDIILARCLRFWRGHLASFGTTADLSASEGIYEVALSRGAHGLSHQFMVQSVLERCCINCGSDASSFDFHVSDERLSVALAERYLGGTSNGITSGIVDSQLAVSFLLSLPLKAAFRIYRSSLPNAIKMRNFERVVTLANIGRAAGSSKGGHWNRQGKFVAQCERLAIKASWWKLLDESGVTFDPLSFPENNEGSNNYSEDISVESSYPASLVPSLIEHRCSKGDDFDRVLACATGFASSFELPATFSIRCCIEFLLSPSNLAHCDSSDIGMGASVCEGRSFESLIKKLLLQLTSPYQRVEVLRRCMVRFEQLRPCVDYERLSMILMLYQGELTYFLSKDGQGGDDTAKLLIKEIELVDRRRDALAILSSYYRDDKKIDRPSFNDFFIPFADTITRKLLSAGIREIKCSILGWRSNDRNDDGFDPLAPLEATLRSSCSLAVASALSPLCFALGVPRGYIRARSLIARFEESKMQGAALPSFEEDVLPILNKLISPSDVSELAEWCSKQYPLGHPDKLQSLDHALGHAVKASNDAERVRADDKTVSLALSRVKGIAAARDLLSDRLALNSILESAHHSQTEDRASFSCLVDKLACKLDRTWEDSSCFIPEEFVSTLFNEASKIAAEAALEQFGSISVGLLRKFSHVVHRISNSIAEKYSHVQVGHLARRLTNIWLVHGDVRLNTTNHHFEQNDMIPIMSTRGEKLIQDNVAVKEADTIDFELDLSLLNTSERKWNPVAAPGDTDTNPAKSEIQSRLSHEQESSSIRPTSAQEMSELMSHRCSLRIAYVMSFADGYSEPSSGSNPIQETSNSLRDTTNSSSRDSMSRQRRGLLSKLKSSTKSEDQHENVLEHCRDLLRIIFAKSSAVSGLVNRVGTPTDSFSVDATTMTSRQKTPDTITFAMRHRALRTAAILLPQQALEQVLTEDEFQTSSPPSQVVSLRACSFGSFVAKEVEEMGLPIPHSDLLQLSTMHFPSYARALWRYHRDNKKGSKGRLLLLILQMYLKESVSDLTFAGCILKEIISLGLPRTLLLAVECTAQYTSNESVPEKRQAFVDANKLELSDSLAKLSCFVQSDVKRSNDNDATDESERCDIDMTSTLLRVACLFGTYMYVDGVQNVWMDFIQGLATLNLHSLSMLKEAQYGLIYDAFHEATIQAPSKQAYRDMQYHLMQFLPQSSHRKDVSDNTPTSPASSADDPLLSFFLSQENNGF
jgi:hypothetical protein